VSSGSAASGRERKLFGKLQVEERRKINTIPSEMDDEDKRSVLVLLPCSSSDLERVAGTRLLLLGTVDSVVILWESVVCEVRLADVSISRVESVGVVEGSKSRLGLEWLEESIVVMR
jgi:hypothetical protein